MTQAPQQLRARRSGGPGARGGEANERPPEGRLALNSTTVSSAFVGDDVDRVVVEDPPRQRVRAIRHLTSSTDGVYRICGAGKALGGWNRSPVDSAFLIRSTRKLRSAPAMRQWPERYQFPIEENTDQGSTSRTVVWSRLKEV